MVRGYVLGVAASPARLLKSMIHASIACQSANRSSGSGSR